jgi:hypothetical protein
MRKKKLGIILILLFAFIFIFSVSNSKAQTSTAASDGSDAIGVRIIPNPNHYSISRWYNSQGFAGSPQSLVVDGYDAIRDGRTVYVNAANIKGKSIYTNIYLISYNQDPSQKTIDILGQIVKNWRFNNDLVEKTNPSPTCAISSLPCLSDSDCATDQYCGTSGIALNSCQLKTPKNCSTDDGCPQNFFCDSVKSKIIRDINRIGKIEELNEALYQYKVTNGKYPQLSAGTYLSNHTVSVWPSWSESFLSTIPMATSFVDPINRLGACAGFDVKTCWNKDTNRFVYDPNSSYLTLPAGSYGFVYKTDAAGSKYSLCSVMETREATSELGFQFSPNNPASSNCVTATGITAGGKAGNTAPYVVDSYLKGEADQAFSGFVKVIDAEGNPLTWSLYTGGDTWTGWSAAPVLNDTNNANQKKIYSAKAGGPKVYNTILKVDDGLGGVLITSTPITIINPKPFIEADDGEYSLGSNKQFSYSFYFSDNNLGTPASAYSVTKLSGPDNFNLLDFKPTIVAAGANRYQVTYQGDISSANKFYNDTSYSYRIKVVDKYNDATTKDFKITLSLDNPNLIFDCLTSQRLGKAYSCFLGYTMLNNHQLSYSNSQLPAGLAINTVSGSTFLSGTTTDPFNQAIAIKVTNEFGASSTKQFNLSVNNYCGDGKKQTPNSEGRGGIYNDGYEDCDGSDGLSLNSQGQPAISTSSSAQYGCTTYSDTPYPIPNNNYCVYKSPADGGGYCGDGYCQLKVDYNGTEISVENSDNCPSDCAAICTPSCANKTCGDDGCGGSCGGCDNGRLCTNYSCCSPQANIQISADDTYSAYFNNNFVASSSSWTEIKKFDVGVQNGKNVVAVNAADLYGISWGLSVSLNQGDCKSMTTDDIADWKCINANKVTDNNWTRVDYDDSSWLTPIVQSNTAGNALPYKQIWSSDANTDHSRIYCRYTFYTQK